MSTLPIYTYLESVAKLYQTNIAKEHAYRGDLDKLIRELQPDVTVVNEPKVSVDCGNPDFVINRGKIPVGYVEAKDINKDLNSKQYDEQFRRYLNALDNLIITDYLWFKFYRNGELYAEIRIANIVANRVVAVHESFETFANLIHDFCTHIGQTIKSASVLAKLMAGKARLLENTIEAALLSDEITHDNSTLLSQLDAFKEVLIHDITPKQFADVYAQTITYGMFAARLHDTTLDTFSREEAASLIPKTNPFLRKLFQYIAGYDIDPRIKLTVDNLAEVFRSTDVAQILKSFTRDSGNEDPIIHFYETFLSEYDPKLRKSRGVWYTPLPVVNFIVRAVDDILKEEFGLPMGLADTSKTTIKVNTTNLDKRSSTGYKQIEKEVHRVQILDPATGTGTFLAEIITNIYNNHFKSMQGAWSQYVDDHLIPRLNGFELLMASYSMAHLKLDLLLNETGYKSTKDQRFRIYLTNSLEEYHPDTGTLFANWLSTEANEANRIKRDTPVMCIIGNPPYSSSSNNKSHWIMNLISDYKKNLKEKKINLDDDYIKFIKHGQHYIDKNGNGILAFITNNSYVNGLTHRQMRNSLSSTFNSIYIINLHGDSNKKEISPDGKPDENVFDIRQGVSISIFIKNNNSKSPCVKYTDIYGSREYKYNALNLMNIKEYKWTKFTPQPPHYYFVPINQEIKNEYIEYLSITELFNEFNSGIQTKRDAITLHNSKEELDTVINFFKTEDTEKIRFKYNLPPDGRDWQVSLAKKDLIQGYEYMKVLYRPFDLKYTIYSGRSKGFIAYPRQKTTVHLLNNANYCLISCRQTKSNPGCFVSIQPIDQKVFSAYDINTMFPLYIYSDNTTESYSENLAPRVPNLNIVIVNKIEKHLNLNFRNEKSEYDDTFSPVDILDYIYGVLHSRNFLDKYKEFLKIDFPRVPYPKNKETFWKLVKLGGEIRQLHLLESPLLDHPISPYPIDGDNVVTKPTYKKERVYINDTQYFDHVPTVAWEFFIGGYQPAQKWLKDRKGRTLSYEDIRHYQRIIVALVETDRLMKEIDQIDFMED